MVDVCVFWFKDSFFFKQKTAYEMRISDWSSDVCSSDLISLSTSARSPPSSFPVPSHKTTRLRPRGTEDAAVSFFFAVAGLPIGTLAIETFHPIAGSNRPHHYTSPRRLHLRTP